MGQRIKTSQQFNEFINSNAQNPSLANVLSSLRLSCYEAIEGLRNRPLLIYSSKFINALPGTPNNIDISDIDGFTDLVQSIRGKSKSVDVLLHSPGGQPDATERIVHILRNDFEEVHFIVPHSAYSAATMLALSGDSITLHPSATLGPIDPQINGTPARSIKRGFDKVKEIIKTEGPEALPAYIPLIEKYSLDLLEICEDSEKLSKELVSNWITDFMLKGKEKHQGQVKDSVEYFSDYDTHLLHSRPLVISKLKKFDLNIYQSEDPLTELIWEAYVHINGFFGLTAFVKLYENRYGVSWGTQFQQMVIQPPPQGQLQRQQP
jgi:Serine dehydrogenase proteinase